MSPYTNPNTLGISTSIYYFVINSELCTRSHCTCESSTKLCSNININMVLIKHPGSKKTKRSGTSSSVHVHHLYTSRSLTGHITLCQEALNATAIQRRQAKKYADHNLCQDAMSMAERDTLNAIYDNNDSASGSVNNSNLEHDAWGIDVNAILAGEKTQHQPCRKRICFCHGDGR
jgi:hypothetical protein